MKIGFVSLGCPKNQLDTEVMLAELVGAGYEITPEDTEADIIVINTCAFIESAKREAIDSILDIAWLKEHHTLRGIIVTGCLSERYRDQIFEEIPEVDAVLGVGSIHNIVQAVESVEKKLRYSSYLPSDEVALGGDRILTTPEYMAYLKIAEGCDNRCSYCAIPSIRGGFRSRDLEELVTEARELESLGVKELVLVAQDTTRYGSDLYGEYSLERLIRKITEETKIPWIRLLYCYPDKITDGLIAEIRDNDRVLKYIDLPIQHISDRVLSRMNRHGDSAMIRNVISRLRESIPQITIRTTFIVGFPGESKEDFEQLCDFVKETGFERAGVFTYSREEGTPSYDFPDQLDEEVKQERADRLMEIQLELHKNNNQRLLGKTIKTLCEGYDAVSGAFYGRSEADAPEIDGKVYFTVSRDKKDRVTAGEFISVKVNEVIDCDLVGVAVFD